MRVAMLVLNDMTWDARVDREASALVEAGHDVVVLALRAEGLAHTEQRNGYAIRRVAGYTTATWRRPLHKVAQLGSRARALVREAADLAPEVIHAHDTDTLSAAGRIAERGAIPLVYDAHELYPDMIAEFGMRGSWPVQRYWQSVERRYVPRAAEVITVSRGLAGELSGRFGVEPVVLRNVPPLAPLVRSERLRAELGLLSDERCVALYQGVLIPGRGLSRLVEAVAEVPDVVLAIQGFGPEEQQMRERAAALNVEERVRFMGKIPPAELHEYACGADIGVLIYEHTTLNNYLASPNKLYAYLMAGLPIVGSAFPGIMEILEGDEVGMTFDPGRPESIAAALRGLALSAGMRETMGARARVLAETRYNWDLEKDALLDVYERLAKGLPTQRV